LISSAPLVKKNPNHKQLLPTVVLEQVRLQQDSPVMNALFQDMVVKKILQPPNQQLRLLRA
jgi:hypothetical protein